MSVLPSLRCTRALLVARDHIDVSLRVFYPAIAIEKPTV
jgi:hypothetical protein